MCQFISFHHRPDNGDIAVSVLDSHADTEKNLSLDLKLWREGHYLPDGNIECRVASDDRVTQEECNIRLKKRFPTFVKFFNWCMKETGQEEAFSGSLNLRGLTSAKGLVLPKSIGGWLNLRGLTSAKKAQVTKGIKVLGKIY